MRIDNGDAFGPGCQPTASAASASSQSGIPIAKPVRVQLSRRKGWRMPPNTVSVARPGQWGNPFKIGEVKLYVNDADASDRIVFLPTNNAEAVAAFRWLASQTKYREMVDDLRGKNLACWCPLDHPCHADVLLELANAPAKAIEAGTVETAGLDAEGTKAWPEGDAHD